MHCQSYNQLSKYFSRGKISPSIDKFAENSLSRVLIENGFQKRFGSIFHLNIANQPSGKGKLDL